VIVPIYNVEKYLSQCLDSILAQTMPKEDFEVLLINDGSTVSSHKICEEYALKSEVFKLYSKDNEGLSKTRNFAIGFAQGKYLLYLDSDDRLTEDTLQKIADFFDEHYDEVDLVTYKIVPIQNGVRKQLHFRYDILKETGVYDLNDGENIYITQTNINIAVKNRGEDNILFDTTKGFYHEDQQYCTDNLRDKMKIGYVKGCEYLYEKNPQGFVSRFNPAMIFDAATSKWEEMFSSFGEKVPEYIQALFVNDIRWKMKEDILLPYHLEGKDYDNAVERLRCLLKKVDNKVILNHPRCDEMNKYYFISMKYNNNLQANIGDKLSLSYGDEIISEFESVNVVLTKIKVRNDKLEICGHLSSPLFDYCEEPELLIRSRGNVYIPMLYKSSFCCDGSKIKNNTAWGFNQTFDLSDRLSFGFTARIAEKEIPITIKTGEWVAFNEEIGRMQYIRNCRKYSLNNKSISVEKCSEKDELRYKIKELKRYFRTNKKIFAVRLLNLLKPKKRIWLYHDCKTSKKDNGYYQFINDFEKNDGVERYYVVNGKIDDVSDLFSEEQKKYLVEFRSNKHKLLYLSAEKIITAFIEKVNYLPFFDDVYKDYMDLFSGDVIYLQHGVLHAHLPHKYSYDRLDVSYEVVSTDFEVENFTNNYCFPQDALIRSKMPRYDFFDTDLTPEYNRIIFAPSWRKYLINLSGDGKWIPTDEKFKASDYYKKTIEFLTSSELADLLEENDWYLDFQLHPIFSSYKKFFETDNERIKIVDSAVPNDYKILITDYSSFVFDFVYLNSAVVYFVPDYREFKTGFNDYKELDIPFVNGFGEFTQTPENALKALESIIKNGGKALPPFDERTENFFFNKEKNCRETIYKSII
ncbi:MAG: glycosyltransferase, partial [Ruminococcus sp.]|nr:glycosyltransferase [Candidatus Copronaster equi]